MPSAIPPINIQTALSVGEPVKNRDTSELNEFVALAPNIARIIPPTNNAINMGLFMMQDIGLRPMIE
jgi:hypothetical protein